MRDIKFSVFASLFLLSCLSQNSFAQDSHSNQLKIYSNFGWESSETVLGLDANTLLPVTVRERDFELGYFSPAMAFSTKRGNFHEIELSRLRINQSDNIIAIDIDGVSPQVISGERVNNIFIALRYEYNLFFLKKDAAKKFHPSVGFAARPFYSITTFNPQLSTVFSTKESNAGIMFSIVPRINYNLNERWYLDLNVPINAGILKLRNRYVANPGIPENQRSITTIDAKVFPTEYLIRFGVGLRL